MRNFLVLLTIILLSTEAGLFAQDAENVELVGQTNYFERANAVVPYEGLLCIASGATGLWVADLSDTTALATVGFLDTPGDALNLDISGATVYLVDGDGGLRIIDISDPVHPREIGCLDTIGHAEQVTVSNGIAFVVADNNMLSVVDVEDPAIPTLIMSVQREGYAIYDIEAFDQFLFVCDENSSILDFSDPANPNEIWRAERNDSFWAVEVSGEYAYVSGFRILGISDPSTPEEIGSTLTEGIYDITVSGDFAYCSIEIEGGRGGRDSPDYQIAIIDITDKSSPTVIGYYDYGLNEYITDIAMMEEFIYVGCSYRNFGGYWSKGVEIIDVANPEEPRYICTLNPGKIEHFALMGDLALLTDQRNGLRVVDFSDPSSPFESAFINIPMPLDIAMLENIAYIATSSRIQIADLSNPLDPELLEDFDVSLFNPRGVAVFSEYLLTFKPAHHPRANIYDLTNPVAPAEIASFNFEEPPMDVIINGSKAFASVGEAGVEATDLSDPLNPVREWLFDTPGFAYGVAVAADLIYVADGDSGLRVLNVSNPDRVHEIGYFYSPGRAYSVTVASDFAFVGTSEGIRVLNVFDPMHPFETGYYETSGFATTLQIRDEILFAAEGGSFSIYDCSLAMSAESEGGVIFPKHFVLHQPYPNPFNSTTTIEYALPFASQVNLNLYNLSGRRIETLVIGRMQAGAHRATLDAGDLASGLYFVKLEGSGQLVTRKLMLVK